MTNNSLNRSANTTAHILLTLIVSCIGTGFISTDLALAQPFPESVDLGSIGPDDGIVLNGTDAGDNAGHRVAGIGDIDDDGIDDVAVTAIHADPNGFDSGEVYILLGNTSVLAPVLDLRQLDGFNGFQLNGTEAIGFAGKSIDGAGDVNGDGIDDVIIGAHLADANGIDSGQAYVLFGRPSFPAKIELSELDGSNGFRINGADADDQIGVSVAGIGDFDQDGFDDIAIGASRLELFGPQSGSVYVIYGKSSFAAETELDLDGSNGFRIDGLDPTDGAGTALSGAGDVNGDNFDDLIIGAPFASPNGTESGAAYVVFGTGDTMPPVVELGDINGTNGVRLEGISAFHATGLDVRSAGDINRDGFDDVIIGAPDADPHGANSGESYAVFGRASFPTAIQLAELDGTDGLVLRGVGFSIHSGDSVAGAGDYNGDGFDDLVIGAPNADANGHFSGQSYVVFGAAMAPDAVKLSELNGANGLIYEGPAESALSGFSVDTAGDFNGDGLDDIVLGGPSANGNAGIAHILFGRTVTGITLGATGGACPGTLRLRSKGLTPGGVFGLYRGSGRGTTVNPNGVCAGVELDLANAALISQIEADDDGRWTFAIEVSSQGACGLSVQVIDLTGCVLSNITTLPEQ